MHQPDTHPLMHCGIFMQLVCYFCDFSPQFFSIWGSVYYFLSFKQPYNYYWHSS